VQFRRDAFAVLWPPPFRGVCRQNISDIRSAI
jgi:hypothetical protein